MALRMIDWKCPKCGAQWEELTNVMADTKVLVPRCRRGCVALCVRIFKAPSIRTADNAPRDMRKFTTAGHVVDGATVKGRRVWDSQLGKETEHMTPREIESFAKKRGLEIVPEKAYSRSHLSYEPPPPRLEDNPALLREAQEEAADTYDQAAAGKLPPVETPLLDEDAEGREAAVEITREAVPIATESAAAVEGA